ncbi:MAG TPA: hypothetical protein VJQ61_02485 [Sinomonas sp.]|nr:hypothetical protein [Sinomonas sp.]
MGQRQPPLHRPCHTKARSWRDDSPEGASAEDLTQAELRARYGIDADEAAGPPQLVQDQYERYELERLRASACRPSVGDDDPPRR